MKPQLKSVTTQVVRNWRYREGGAQRKGIRTLETPHLEMNGCCAEMLRFEKDSKEIVSFQSVLEECDWRVKVRRCFRATGIEDAARK